MHRLTFIATLGLMALLLSCAAKHPRIDGLWQDASALTEFEIVKSNGGFEMMSIIDSDGEVFELRDFEYSNGILRFTYFVPSTDYVVNFKTLVIHEDSMECRWWGTGGDGSEILLRLE
jgi:hypothetical protein